MIAGLSLDQGALNAAREYGFIVLKMDGATLSNQTPRGFGRSPIEAGSFPPRLVKRGILGKRGGMWHNPEMMKKSPGKSKARRKPTKAAAKKPAPLVVARLEMPEDIRTELRGVMERMDAVTARMDAMHSDHEG